MTAVLRRPLWLVLILLGSIAPSILASQSQGFRWWTSDQFKSELGLTADQSARINKIYQDTLPELHQEWDELDRLETKLSRLFESSSSDEAVLARQIDRVETARANLNKSRALMLMRMRRVLTTEQLVRFKTLAERYDAEARKSGPSRPSGGRR